MTSKDTTILLRFWPDLPTAAPSVRTDQQRRQRCRWPSRSRIGGSCIKRRPHVEAATCSKGRARVCHKRLTATAVAAAARASGHRMQQRPSCATGGSPRLPTVSYQRPTAHKPLRRCVGHSHTLAAGQVVATVVGKDMG
ncbi:hypothetical protein BHE74_00035935 [Ensete ventricosum]|nr:hypothetical protein BHE74_00035935 [Ensete ventricosum]